MYICVLVILAQIFSSLPLLFPTNVFLTFLSIMFSDPLSLTRAVSVTTGLELPIGVLDSAVGTELKTVTDSSRIYSQHFIRKIAEPYELLLWSMTDHWQEQSSSGPVLGIAAAVSPWLQRLGHAQEMTLLSPSPSQLLHFCHLLFCNVPWASEGVVEMPWLGLNLTCHWVPVSRAALRLYIHYK